MTQKRNLTTAATAPRVIDSRRLFYFYHVARLGGFTYAEQYLHVAQSALSRQVQMLEQELGAVLLQRDVRGVTLTDIGQIVFRRAGEMIQLMDDMMLELETARTEPVGKVSIAATHTFMTAFMPRLIERFSTAYPRVKLHVVESLTGQIYDRLIDGEVDIAVMPDPPLASKLILEEIFAEQLFVIGRPGLPLVEGSVVTAAQLHEAPVALPATNLGLRTTIDSYASANGVQPAVQIELDSLSLLKNVVMRTPSYTILSFTACAADVDAGRLVARPLEPALVRSTYIASVEGRPLSVAARMLAKEIRNVIRDQSSSNPAHLVSR